MPNVTQFHDNIYWPFLDKAVISCWLLMCLTSVNPDAFYYLHVKALLGAVWVYVNLIFRYSIIMHTFPRGEIDWQHTHIHTNEYILLPVPFDDNSWISDFLKLVSPSTHVKILFVFLLSVKLHFSFCFFFTLVSWVNYNLHMSCNLISHKSTLHYSFIIFAFWRYKGLFPYRESTNLVLQFYFDTYIH